MAKHVDGDVRGDETRRANLKTDLRVNPARGRHDVSVSLCSTPVLHPCLSSLPLSRVHCWAALSVIIAPPPSQGLIFLLNHPSLLVPSSIVSLRAAFVTKSNNANVSSGV